MPSAASVNPCILESQYKEDTKLHLLKCLNEDLGFSKIQKAFKSDFKAIKVVLQENFESINNIFLFYSGQSHAYPAIAKEDFMGLAEESFLVSQGLISERMLNKCFAESVLSENKYKKSIEKTLNRYEFIEVLVRIAAVLCNTRRATETTTIAQTLNSLLTELIIPNSQQVNRVEFRRMLIADPRVAELLNRNSDCLKSAFSYFTDSKKKSSVNLEECVALARQCQLDVPDQILGVVFAESLMTVIDTMRVKERMY